MDHEESALHDSPLEFMTSVADSGGYCDGQSILPEGDHYVCHCTCGSWDVEASSQDGGVHMARVHTGSVPA